MGVGSPKELVVAVQSGIDLFDCVLPTRAGRTGLLFSRQGPVKIRNARYQKDPRPADADCPCLLCRQHSLGYLRHLFQAGEMLGPMLATRHNLTFFARLIADLRSWIAGSPPVDFTWLDRHYDADPSL
jgi:queuine tRNA-ribosyltransferase